MKNDNPWWIFTIQSVILALFILPNSYSFYRMNRLSKDNATSEGVLERESWLGKGSHRYSFVINDKRYENSDRPVGTRQEGKNVLVYYSPENPNLSSLRLPNTKKEDIFEQMRFVIPVFIITTSLSIFYFRKRKQDANQAFQSTGTSPAD